MIVLQVHVGPGFTGLGKEVHKSGFDIHRQIAGFAARNQGNSPICTKYRHVAYYECENWAALIWHLIYVMFTPDTYP